MIVVSVEFLSTIPPVFILSPAQLTEISSHWNIVDKKKDEVIFKKGDPSDAIFSPERGSNRLHSSPLTAKI